MPRTRVKSTKRREHALRIMAGLPRDPATGRLLKRTGAPITDPPGKQPPAPDPQTDPQKPPTHDPKPAGGPDPSPKARGIRRWTNRRST